MTKTNSHIKKRPLRQKIGYSIISTFIFLLLFLIVGEITARIFYKNRFDRGIPTPPDDTSQKDDLLGWTTKPNYSYTGTALDQNGDKYPISINFDKNGFKTFGDIHANKPKVFFIGDSYVASVEASNEKTFYNLIADSLDIEVFAFGQPGYGTLQEYMIVDKWLDIIQPDLIVWGVCSNDIIDNCFSLEKVCGYKMDKYRPYLGLDGKIFYDRPFIVWDDIKKTSYFIAWLDESIRHVITLTTEQKYKNGEQLMLEQKRNFPPFDEAVKTTELIVEKIKNSVPDSIPIIAFSVDYFTPQITEMNRIFTEAGYLFTTDISLAMNRRVFHKENVKTIDTYHWNENGQKVVANALAPFIKSMLGI